MFFWEALQRCLDPDDPWYGGSILVVTPTFGDLEKGFMRTMEAPAGPPAYGFGELWDAVGEYNGQTHTYTIRYTTIDPETGKKRRRSVKAFFVSANEGTASVIAVRAQAVYWDECDKTPKGIYSDLLSRTATTNCPILMTTTPYGGKYSWIRDWEREAARDDPANGGPGALGRHLIQASRLDNPAVSDAVLLRDYAAMTPQQFRRRVLGEHSYEEGMVWPMFRSEMADKGGHLIDPMPFNKVPDWWQVYCGIDLGARWFAMVWLLRDEDNNWYVADSYLSENESTPVRADFLKAHPLAKRVKSYVYDPSGRQGAIDLRQYQVGLVWPADNKVEPGLDTVARALVDRKLFFWDTPHNQWLIREMDMYHYDATSRIVDEDDHGCDAVRYGLQTLFLTTPPRGPRPMTRTERYLSIWSDEEKDPEDVAPSDWRDF